MNCAFISYDVYKGGIFLNSDFDEFRQTIQSFSDWLDQIPPYEYSLYATITGYIISLFLDTGAQNAFGNWLEQVGQIILTVSAQASATPTNDEYNALKAEIRNLRREIERLKRSSNTEEN